MMDHSCPQCGSASRLLFNLVACITPDCRNYEEAWHSEWSQTNKPRYRHNTHFGVDHKFLGGFTSAKGVYFDLYACEEPVSAMSMGLARCGDNDLACYYVDDNETEIGTVSQGPLKSVSSCVVEALQAALKKLRGLKKKKK